MLRNYFTLYHAARELHEQLSGGYLFEIHSQQKNEITIAFITADGRHLQLIVTVRSPWFSLYTREGLNRKQRNTAGIMTGICERQITEVTIPPGDRQIIFSLEDRHALALRMFSAETNLLLAREGRIIDAFKDGKKLENSPFTTVADAEPVFSTLEKLCSPERFQQAYDRSRDSVDPERALLAMLPGFDRKLVRKLIAMADDDSPEALHEAFVTLFYDLASPFPCVIERAGEAPVFSLFEPDDSSTTTPFDTVLDALSHYSRRMYRYLHLQERVAVMRRSLLEKIGKAEREIAAGDTRDLDTMAGRFETFGHLLTGAIGTALPAAGKVAVPNLFEPESPEVIIDVKPELNMQENAAWYFSHATKSRKKAEGMRLRHELLRKEIDTLRQKIDEIDAAVTPEQIQQSLSSGLPKGISPATKKTDKKEKKAPPFRTVPLTETITMYIGRNTASNEQLTFGFARPDDIWLHARGTSGSHCLLKGAHMNNTSELRRAAEIAAWHSSARNSELVPVICTQKKYLKKDRKKPGNVIIERETVIMAKPMKE